MSTNNICFMLKQIKIHGCNLRTMKCLSSVASDLGLDCVLRHVCPSTWSKWSRLYLFAYVKDTFSHGTHNIEFSILWIRLFEIQKNHSV